jgi:hypothetical protein
MIGRDHFDMPQLSRHILEHIEKASREAPGWWRHINLDVLDGKECSACGAASDSSTLGG